MKTVILYLCMLCASCAMANEEACLKFSKGFEENKVMDYLKSKKLETNPDTGKYYSSSYDLNGDGNNEYFYYFEHFYFCGTGTLCRLKAYTIEGTKFRRILSLHPLYDFNPESDDHENYICVLSVKDGPWKRLKIDNRFEQKYVDGFYKTIKE